MSIPDSSAMPSRPARPNIATGIHPEGPVSAPSAGSLGVVAVDDRFTGIDLNSVLVKLVQAGGSDLHLSAGAPPLFRINGSMQAVPGAPVLSETAIRDAIYGILTDEQRAAYEHDWELDFAHTIPDVSRFRVNVMRQRGQLGAVFRAIPSEIRTLESLGLSPILYNFSALPRGLVLVTGPTGSGKSTTIASLIDRANRTRSGHIITIEDPIEFLHTHRSSVVNQREVGSDTHSYSDALKHVLRQDPDIILIGEMRDLETISTALTAAETGHLVFATLHTQSAQDTINRIIDVFPSGQQQQIRSQLAATLRGVVCQTLVKRADGKGRAAAAEIMMVNPAIAAMIRKDEIHQIPHALQSGGELGMQTLNQSLADLVVRGQIERETAEEFATDQKDLDALIKGRQDRYGGQSSVAPRATNGGLAGSSL